MIWPACYWISHTVDWLKAQTVTEFKNTPMRRRQDGGDGKQFHRGRTQRVRRRDVRFLAAQLEKTRITWTLTHDELRWCERNKWYFRGKCVTSWCHLLHLAPSYSSSHNKSLFSRSRYSYIHLWCHRFPLKTSPLFYVTKETNLFLLGLIESVSEPLWFLNRFIHSPCRLEGKDSFFPQVFARWRNEDFGGSK